MGVTLPIAEEIVKELRLYCNEWIEETDNVPVFKGTELALNRLHGNMGLFRNRRNRVPRDTPLSLQVKIDTVMHRLGIKARRENSVFCTSMKHISQLYGEAYIIYPVNGYSYSFFNVNDLYYILYWFFDEESGIDMNTDFTELENFEEDYLPYFKEKEFEEFTKKTIQTSDIDQAIRTGSEILVNCDYYYLVHSSFENYLGML